MNYFMQRKLFYIILSFLISYNDFYLIIEYALQIIAIIISIY